MIHFFGEDVDFDTSSLRDVPSWLSHVASRHQQSIDCINYIFCSDSYLLKINQDHLSHDYFTDIITFDNRDIPSQPIEGDIFISIDRVTENARIHEVLFFNELLRVIVHGLLHLLGYSDTTDTEKSKMRDLETQLIDQYFQLFQQT